MPARGSAVVKQAITQRSFLLGETREGFLEGDDLEIRQMSCRKAKNVRVTATRTLKVRPGTEAVRTLRSARDVIELRPESGVVFGLIVNDGSLQVIDASGGEVFGVAPVPWSASAEVWVEPFRADTIIGGEFGIHQLTYKDGAWSFVPFLFEDAANGDRAQPYWSFTKNFTIRPSARTGMITLTASGPIWSPQYVGQRVRYGQREVLVSEYISPTVLRARVLSKLPPSFRVILKSQNDGFRVGDTIVSQDTNYQGVVVRMGFDNVVDADPKPGQFQFLDVVTTSYFQGPSKDEKISAPSATAEIHDLREIGPLSSPIWDEPLMSPIRGFPRAGASAAGRLTLVDFPQVPDLICMSSSRSIRDFKTGIRDDDGITRTAGDNSPRFMHVLNAGDLILFSDRGVYYVSLRDGGLLTPTSFNAIQFDKRGANDVRPVPVDDGVVFVEASGESIAVAMLAGTASLKWTVRTISTYHSHLIRTPRKLCGPSLFAQTPEKYLFVVNADGTLAAVSWFADFEVDSVGFVPWETQGSFRSVSPIFGGYWAIVDRMINGAVVRFLERFSDDTNMDCSALISVEEALTVNGQPLMVNGQPLTVSTPASTPLIGAAVHVSGGGWYGGTRTVAADGSVPDVEDLPVGSIAGFNFDARVMPWPVENIDHPKAGMLKARLIRGSVSVMHTGPFDVRANRSTRAIGGYRVGEDLSQPPPLRTEVSKFSVIGRRDHPEIEIIRDKPGAFEVLAITQELQA